MNKRAALLEKPEVKKNYKITIEVNNSDTVSMVFTNRLHAQQEYNRIKAAGVYLGQWTKRVEFDEIIIDC